VSEKSIYRPKFENVPFLGWCPHEPTFFHQLLLQNSSLKSFTNAKYIIQSHLFIFIHLQQPLPVVDGGRPKNIFHLPLCTTSFYTQIRSCPIVFHFICLVREDSCEPAIIKTRKGLFSIGNVAFLSLGFILLLSMSESIRHCYPYLQFACNAFPPDYYLFNIK
jgi:hypothetical protein